MESVNEDEPWIEAAAKGIHDDSELYQRASLALRHPLVASQNDDCQPAIRNLLQFGLAAEMSAVPGTSSELSHYIATLLNFFTANKRLAHTTSR